VGNAFALSTFPQAGRRANSGDHFFGPEGPFVVVSPQASLAVKDGVGSVQVLPDLDFGLDEMGAQRALGDLQLEPVEGHAIVVADAAFFLNAQDLAEIDALDGDEGVARTIGAQTSNRPVGRTQPIRFDSLDQRRRQFDRRRSSA
jgi:hypothetical protein